MEKPGIPSNYSQTGLYAGWTAASAGKSDEAMARPEPGDTEIDRIRRYPRLAGVGDLPARAAEDWEREYSVRKGSRRDFADAIRARLNRWAASGADTRRTSLEHREFRNEAAMIIGMRLEKWVEAGIPVLHCSPCPDPAHSSGHSTRSS
jgi:hypothetical protein